MMERICSCPKYWWYHTVHQTTQVDIFSVRKLWMSLIFLQSSFIRWKQSLVIDLVWQVLIISMFMVLVFFKRINYQQIILCMSWWPIEQFDWLAFAQSKPNIKLASIICLHLMVHISSMVLLLPRTSIFHTSHIRKHMILWLRCVGDICYQNHSENLIISFRLKKSFENGLSQCSKVISIFLFSWIIHEISCLPRAR